MNFIEVCNLRVVLTVKKILELIFLIIITDIDMDVNTATTTATANAFTATATDVNPTDMRAHLTIVATT